MAATDQPPDRVVVEPSLERRVGQVERALGRCLAEQPVAALAIPRVDLLAPARRRPVDRGDGAQMRVQGIDLLQPCAQGGGVERERERPPVADPAYQRGGLVAVEYAVAQVPRPLGEESRVGPVAATVWPVAGGTVDAVETLAPIRPR